MSKLIGTPCENLITQNCNQAFAITVSLSHRCSGKFLLLQNCLDFSQSCTQRLSIGDIVIAKKENIFRFIIMSPEFQAVSYFLLVFIVLFFSSCCLCFLFLAALIKQESAFKKQNVSVKAVEVSKQQTALQSCEARYDKEKCKKRLPGQALRWRPFVF